MRWLAEGVWSWNRRRRREPFTPDLRGFDIDRELRKEQDLQEFDGVELTGVDMRGAKLQGASLQRCILDKSDFRSADLTGSDLTYTSIVGANFDGAILNDAEMAYAKCMRTRFSYGRLRDAILFEEPDRTVAPEFVIYRKTITTVARLLSALHYLHKRPTRRGDPTIIGPPRMFYRGHGVHSWDLIPSVFRPTEKNLRDIESEMLTEFISKNPNEFVADVSLLSLLVKAREYGLPTRLLDISSDPLVALFFAVEDKKYDRCDGALHVFAVPQWIVKPFNSDSIAVICAYARLGEDDQRMLVGEDGFTTRIDEDHDMVSGDTNFRWSDVMDRLVGEITKEGRGFSDRIDPFDLFRVFVVTPKVDDQRLRQQSGAFLLSASHKSFELESVQENTPYVPLYDHYKLTINAEAKPNIREELERLNITRESLLSSLEVSAEAIRKRHGFK